MLRFLKRGGGNPLLILLFATILGSSSCAHSGKEEESEPTQNEDLAAEAEDGEEGSNANLQENLSNEEAKEEAPADVAVVDQPLAQAIPVQERGYVGGKAGNPMEMGLPESGSKMAYIVVKGDTLSKIAKRIFSDMKRWQDLAVATSVKNPNLIYPGDVVYYQLDTTTLAFAKQYESMKRDETIAQEGDSLLDISKRVYGDKDQWKLIWRHNDQINDPSNLQAGTHVYYVNPQALVSLDKNVTKLKVEVSSTKRTYRHHKKV